MSEKIGFYALAWVNFNADIYYWDGKEMMFLTCTGIWKKSHIFSPASFYRDYQQNFVFLGV